MLFWGWVRAISEEQLSLDFSRGLVVEKYRSTNHGRLAIRVKVADRGNLEVEGVSSEIWGKISVGSTVSKRCGLSDVTIVAP